MKTVLLFIDTLKPAGAQRFVVELACNLDKKVYKPIVVTTNELDTSTAFYRQLLANDIVVVNVGCSSYVKEFRHIKRLIQKENPFIIHSNVGSVLYVIPVLILTRGTIKHLFTVHSMGYRIFTGWKKRFIRYCFRKQFVIPVAISDTVRQSVINEYDLHSDNVECVYNGVDTKKFFPVREKQPISQFTFISVGTLYEIKNHKLLISAFSILRSKYDGVSLRIVGDGVLKDELFQQTEELGISKDVIFEGKQDNVADFLNGANVYVCTSIVEGLPIAVIEAMACGLPIISTPAGGVIDIVEEGENGYIVDYKADHIAEAMERLLTDEILYKSMSVESRKKALALDLNICTRNYEKLYEKYGILQS